MALACSISAAARSRWSPGSTIVVNNSAQLRVAASEFNASTYGIVLNGTSQLQFAQSGGGQFANAISGTGELHLIGGTLQLTGTNNTYSGGTVVETGSTLDITTANLPTGQREYHRCRRLDRFRSKSTGADVSGTFTASSAMARKWAPGRRCLAHWTLTTAPTLTPVVPTSPCQRPDVYWRDVCRSRHTDAWRRQCDRGFERHHARPRRWRRGRTDGRTRAWRRQSTDVVVG